MRATDGTTFRERERERGKTKTKFSNCVIHVFVIYLHHAELNVFTVHDLF